MANARTRVLRIIFIEKWVSRSVSIVFQMRLRYARLSFVRRIRRNRGGIGRWRWIRRLARDRKIFPCSSSCCFAFSAKFISITMQLSPAVLLPNYTFETRHYYNTPHTRRSHCAQSRRVIGIMQKNGPALSFTNVYESDKFLIPRIVTRVAQTATVALSRGAFVRANNEPQVHRTGFPLRIYGQYARRPQLTLWQQLI